MPPTTARFSVPLATKVESLLARVPQIPDARLPVLLKLVEEVATQREAGGPVRLHFICTHNSRRSQLSQVWAAAAAEYFRIDGIETFSGGTEATAFNPRAVAALRRAGFTLDPLPSRPGAGQTPDSDIPPEENIRYAVRYSEDRAPLICFSKVIDALPNPTRDFLAVMTCGSADESCPVIPGAKRIALLYEDPKAFDGTPEESMAYDTRSDQIGTELLWVFRAVRDAEA